MSMENARRFYEKVSADKGLQQKIGELIKKDPKKIGAVIIKTAKENGFEFTEAEMKAYIAEKAKTVKPNQELSDSQLESVAGGGKTDWVVESIASVGASCAASATFREVAGGCTLDAENHYD